MTDDPYAGIFISAQKYDWAIIAGAMAEKLVPEVGAEEVRARMLRIVRSEEIVDAAIAEAQERGDDGGN